MNIRVDYLKDGDIPLYNKTSDHVITIGDTESHENGCVCVPLIQVGVGSFRSIVMALEQGEREKKETATVVLSDQKIGVLVM